VLHCKPLLMHHIAQVAADPVDRVTGKSGSTAGHAPCMTASQTWSDAGCVSHEAAVRGPNHSEQHEIGAQQPVHQLQHPRHGGRHLLTGHKHAVSGALHTAAAVTASTLLSRCLELRNSSGDSLVWQVPPAACWAAPSAAQHRHTHLIGLTEQRIVLLSCWHRRLRVRVRALHAGCGGWAEQAALCMRVQCVHWRPPGRLRCDAITVPDWRHCDDRHRDAACERLRLRQVDVPTAAGLRCLHVMACRNCFC
jgi:hypothetical protein